MPSTWWRRRLLVVLDRWWSPTSTLTLVSGNRHVPCGLRGDGQRVRQLSPTCGHRRSVAPVRTLSSLVADNQSRSRPTTLADGSARCTRHGDQPGQHPAREAGCGAEPDGVGNRTRLRISVENLSASESTDPRRGHRDGVFSELVTRQIMQQAGVSVLAQANAVPAERCFRAPRLTPARLIAGKLGQAMTSGWRTKRIRVSTGASLYCLEVRHG